MPSLTEDETKEEDDEEEGIPTPPSTPKDETPQPVFPDVAQVTRRLSKKSGARPRLVNNRPSLANTGSILNLKKFGPGCKENHHLDFFVYKIRK